MASEYTIKRNKETLQRMQDALPNFQKVWPMAALIEVHDVTHEDYRAKIKVTPEVEAWFYGPDSDFHFYAAFEGELARYARSNQITEGPRYAPQNREFEKPNKMRVFRGSAAQKWVEYYTRVFNWVAEGYSTDLARYNKEMDKLSGLIVPGVGVTHCPDLNQSGTLFIKTGKYETKVNWSKNADRLTFDIRTESRLICDLGRQIFEDDQFVPHYKISWDFLHMAGKIKLLGGAEEIDMAKRTNSVRFQIVEPVLAYKAGDILENVVNYAERETLADKVLERQALINTLASAYYPGFVAWENMKQRNEEQK